MSDTPRTDDIVMQAVAQGMRLAPVAEFCRELERENVALLDLIEDMANQHCRTCIADRDYNGQLAGTRVTDSGAISASANALRFLAAAKPPRFRVVAEFGRMVVGYWPDNDPQKQPSSTPSDP